MTDAFGFSLSYPFSNSDSKYAPLAKLTVLFLLSFLVIPGFTMFGYILRIREAAMRGDEEIPPLVDWWELTREGFYGILALIPYSLLAMVLIVVSMGITGAVFGFESAGGSAAIITVYLASIILVTYATPGAISVYAVERSYKSIYSRKLYEFVANSTYAKGWVMYVLLIIGIYILAVLSIFTVVGVFLVAPLASLIRSSFWGSIGRDIIEDHVELEFKNSPENDSDNDEQSASWESSKRR